jgi:hypothetical protein
VGQQWCGWDGAVVSLENLYKDFCENEHIDPETVKVRRSHQTVAAKQKVKLVRDCGSMLLGERAEGPVCRSDLQTCPRGAGRPNWPPRTLAAPPALSSWLEPPLISSIRWTTVTVPAASGRVGRRATEHRGASASPALCGSAAEAHQSIGSNRTDSSLHGRR